MKALIFWMILGQAGDLITTRYALDHNCVESNPIIKNHQKVGNGIKIGITIGAGFTKNKLVIGSVASVGTFGTIWNLNQGCK